MAVNMTAAAAEHVRKQLADHPGHIGLRLGVKKSGCTGFGYVLDFAKELGQGDQVFESQGVQVVINSDSLVALDGIELDYVEQGLNRVFTFNNPNVKDMCGCGESFSV